MDEDVNSENVVLEGCVVRALWGGSEAGGCCCDVCDWVLDVVDIVGGAIGFGEVFRGGAVSGGGR